MRLRSSLLYDSVASRLSSSSFNPNSLPLSCHGISFTTWSSRGQPVHLSALGSSIIPPCSGWWLLACSGCVRSCRMPRSPHSPPLGLHTCPACSLSLSYTRLQPRAGQVLKGTYIGKYESCSSEASLGNLRATSEMPSTKERDSLRVHRDRVLPWVVTAAEQRALHMPPVLFPSS